MLCKTAAMPEAPFCAICARREAADARSASFKSISARRVDDRAKSIPNPSPEAIHSAEPYNRLLAASANRSIDPSSDGADATTVREPAPLQPARRCKQPLGKGKYLCSALAVIIGFRRTGADQFGERIEQQDRIPLPPRQCACSKRAPNGRRAAFLPEAPRKAAAKTEADGTAAESSEHSSGRPKARMTRTQIRQGSAVRHFPNKRSLAAPQPAHGTGRAVPSRSGTEDRPPAWAPHAEDESEIRSAGNCAEKSSKQGARHGGSQPSYADHLNDLGTASPAFTGISGDQIPSRSRYSSIHDCATNTSVRAPSFVQRASARAEALQDADTAAVCIPAGGTAIGGTVMKLCLFRTVRPGKKGHRLFTFCEETADLLDVFRRHLRRFDARPLIAAWSGATMPDATPIRRTISSCFFSDVGALTPNARARLRTP